MGFPKYEKEDYGQTLGKWGVGPGCYMVLPVLGPSTVGIPLVLLLIF
jgi:phospholipid-binding lipoprotein MlaA